MRPVFIGGFGRSGTTMLADALGFHPRISPIYETDFVLIVLQLVFNRHRYENVHERIRDLMVRWTAKLPMRPNNKRAYERYAHGPHHILFGRDYARARTEIFLEELDARPAEAFRSFILDLFQEHCLVADKARWVNKTPSNLQFASGLRVLFPDMLLVHIVRDGRDVACSVVTRDWGPKTYAKTAHWWSDAVVAGTEFGQQHPRQYVCIRYEDLVREPESALRPVVEAMGEEVPSDMVRRWLEQVGGTDASRIGDYQQAFSEEDHETFERVAGAALATHGYSLQRGGPPELVLS